MTHRSTPLNVCNVPTVHTTLFEIHDPRGQLLLTPSVSRVALASYLMVSAYSLKPWGMDLQEMFPAFPLVFGVVTRSKSYQSQSSLRVFCQVFVPPRCLRDALLILTKAPLRLLLLFSSKVSVNFLSLQVEVPVTGALGV